MSQVSIDIEQELNKLWEKLAQEQKARACLFTLIIWTGDRQEYFQEVAKRVLENFPCRLMFIQPCHQDARALKVDVSAVVDDQNNSSIACDRIDVELGVDARQQLPSLLLPHLVPDLPVYLMWGEDPSVDGSLFESLRPWATKLIFDSEITRGLQRFAQKLIQLHSVHGQDIADLNWVRTEPWRDLISKTFNSQEGLDSLLQAEFIRIHYNECQGTYCTFTTAQAIYLQAWLAAKLHWGAGAYDQIEHHQRISCTTVHGQVIFLILPEERPVVPEGQVCGVEITAKDESRYLFKRLDHPGFAVDVFIEHRHECEMPIHVIRTEFSRGHSLASEIISPGTSEHFMEMLYWLSRASPDTK